MTRAIETILAIAVVVGALFGFSALTYWLDALVGGGVAASLVNLLMLMLVAVMIIATLLTLAERKWSAMIQDRVGPNRARFNLPGLRNRPLGGIPHIAADVVKMLTKESFAPASASRLLYELAPMVNFAPVFCLFAVVPAGPEVTFAGTPVSLQVAHPDFGILFVFALASLSVYGTALAGWASNNKFALLGGVRATSQMISYEVALGLSLVGAMIAFSTVRLDAMAVGQGAYLWRTAGAFDFGLPAWGIFLQPVGFILFFAASFAETKRAPFDLPEGESEVIGYFLEYSGMRFGMFMITEFVEIVILSGVLAAVFLGGYHLPFGEEWLKAAIGAPLLAVVQATIFWIKLIALCWLQLAIRWTFPRFRYDQIQRLGWRMLLPAGLANVFLTGALVLWDPSLHALAIVGLLEIATILLLIPAPSGEPEHPLAAPSHGGH